MMICDDLCVCEACLCVLITHEHKATSVQAFGMNAGCIDECLNC